MASLSTYAFSAFYTTLPHNLIKDKLRVVNLHVIERIFQREIKLVKILQSWLNINAKSIPIMEAFITVELRWLEH